MTFVSPLFLIGLVAIAIPILVHLFNFRRYKKVYFSNVRRLEQLQSETRRQSKLRQLLIMAARILAIVFLVLAFARPVLTGKDQEIMTGSNDVSIYIDNSYSMELSDGSGTLIEKAKSKAREIVSAYGSSDRFQLLTGDMEGQQFHWLSKEEVMLQIDAVEVSPASPDLSTVSRRQQEFLRHGTGDNRHAYIVSDFQNSVFEPSRFEVDSMVITTFVPLSSVRQENIYIDSLALNAPVFGKGNSVAVEVMLRNEGDENVEKAPVTMYINERQRALATVDIPAHGSESVTMRFTIDATGMLQGRVEIADYPVTFDDQYFFSLNVRDKIRMLCVEGQGENIYLRRLFAGDSSVAYMTIPSQQMDFSQIGGNDIIVLDGLTRLESGMVQSLHSFVDEGGTVVIVAGERVDESSYNDALRQFSAPVISDYSSGRSTANAVNIDHALYSNVFDDKSEDMELPTVNGYYQLSLKGGVLYEPLITLSNGDSYVGVVPCGEGRLYVVTAPLNEAHTDFVRQALFVPTFYNMALYSIRPTPPAATLGDNRPVPLAGRYDVDDGVTRLTKGDYEEIPDIRRMGGNSYLVQHSTLREAGNYVLMQGEVQREGIAFNYPRHESRLEFIGRDALEQILKDYNMYGYNVVRNTNKPLDTYLREKMEGRGLWRWCIVLCLLMIMAEIILIRVGHRPEAKREVTMKQ